MTSDKFSWLLADNAMTVEHNGGKNGDATLADNRRQWIRRPSDLTEITVVCGGEQQQAAVVDESLGGIGIKMAEVSQIVRGQQLKLLYHGIPVLGVVRRVQPEDDGHRVGVEWLNTRRDESATKHTNRYKRAAQYISFSGFCVNCRVEEHPTDGRICVTLPDGSHCDVRTGDILTRTLAERRAELDALTLDLTMLAGVYQLGEHPTKDARIDAIVDFEFKRHVETVADLVEQVRTKNKTILDQQQRIEELESYLGCIVGLSARVRELELEIGTTA